MTGKKKRVVRGGSFFSTPARCRSTFRRSIRTRFRIDGFGFRLSVTPSGKWRDEPEASCVSDRASAQQMGKPPHCHTESARTSVGFHDGSNPGHEFAPCVTVAGVLGETDSQWKSSACIEAVVFSPDGPLLVSRDTIWNTLIGQKTLLSVCPSSRLGPELTMDVIGSVDPDPKRAMGLPDNDLEQVEKPPCTGACTDERLATLIAAWQALPENVRRAIATLCGPYVISE